MVALVLVAGIMNGKGFLGNGWWMRWLFLQQTESPTSPQKYLLPLPLSWCESLTAAAHDSLICLDCQDISVNCIERQSVCLCLEYSDFSLGCLPLVECLCLEYWASVTPSLRPVWSISLVPELRNIGPKMLIKHIAILGCWTAMSWSFVGWSQNSYTELEPAIMG